MVYEKLQGPASVEKSENTYAQAAQRIAGLKESRKMNISKRPLAVTIRPREKEKFKSMDEVKAALQKSYCPSTNNVRIRRIVKRKEDILIETDTIESLEKLKGSADILKKFEIQEVKRNKPKIIVYDVSNNVSERLLAKLIFDKNEIDMEWAQFHESCTPKFKTGPKGKENSNWVFEVSQKSAIS